MTTFGSIGWQSKRIHKGPIDVVVMCELTEDIMSIPTDAEAPELFDNFNSYEVCLFCKTETRFWHSDTNNPVCKKCAKTHRVTELHSWKKNTIDT